MGNILVPTLALQRNLHGHSQITFYQNKVFPLYRHPPSLKVRVLSIARNSLLQTLHFCLDSEERTNIIHSLDLIRTFLQEGVERSYKRQVAFLKILKVGTTAIFPVFQTKWPVLSQVNSPGTPQEIQQQEFTSLWFDIGRLFLLYLMP